MIDYSKLTNKQHRIINDIIDNYNFDVIADYMKNTNWVWADMSNVNSIDEMVNAPVYVPNVPELRGRLRELLQRTFINANEGNIDGPYYISTGGFTVYVWKTNECHVHFSIEDYFGDGDE